MTRKWQTNFITAIFVLALMLSGMYVDTGNTDSLFVFGQQSSETNAAISFSDDYTTSSICTNELLGQRSVISNLRSSRRNQNEYRTRRDVANIDFHSDDVASSIILTSEHGRTNCQFTSISIIISYIHQEDGQK